MIGRSSTDESVAFDYIINISDDEKTAWINWNNAGQPISGPGYQAPCNRFRETLTWSLTFPESMATDTLRIDGNGNANFAREGAWTSGDNQGITYHQSGIFPRMDASSAPSVPQTASTAPVTTPIATAAPNNASGLPTARPVPNKSGFVYNPFDPNSKMLLDVRSKKSGTKVKDPVSGKLFIVP